MFRNFKTFEEAFLKINKEITENPQYTTTSRIGDVSEIQGYTYTINELSSFKFENEFFYECLHCGETNEDAFDMTNFFESLKS